MILALGACLPLLALAPSPTASLVGHPLSDVWKHAWSFWHVPATLGTWPWTPYLAAPGGGVLLDPMLLPAVLLAPVSGLAGPVAATNLWVWLSLWAIGAATWALARELTGAQVGAVVAGLVAQTAPYIYGYPLYGGVHERLTLWVFPAVLWALLRRARGGGHGWSAGAVLLAGTAVLGCHVYGLFLAVFLALCLPLLGPRGLWRTLPALVGIGLVLGGVQELATTLSDDPRALVPQHGRGGLRLDSGGAATWAAMFDPRVSRAMPATQVGDLLVPVVYVGWLPVGAALLGAARHRSARWAAGAALVLVGLTALPTLPGARDALVGDWRDTISVWSALATRWQQVAVVTPLLAVAAAALVGERRVRGVLVVLLIGLERALSSPIPLVLPATAAQVDPAYTALNGQSGAVAELPRMWRDTRLAHGQGFLAQTVHQLPRVANINPDDDTLAQLNGLRTGRSQDWPALVGSLRAHGVRWLVVHDQAYADPARATATRRQLVTLLGPPVGAGTTVGIFEL